METKRRGVLRTALEMLKEERRLLADTLLLGIVGALAAQAFTLLLRGAEFLFLKTLAGYVPPTAPEGGIMVAEHIGPHGLWLIPLVTTAGGLISGILVYAFAPEAEGHGTDTVVRAFHRAGGMIRARVAPVKMLASAITIGSGGAAGREGPIALIAAGFGSSYASVTRRSEADRRLLVLIGTAAGLAAIFRSPIGTAVFAVEVLYGGMEFEGGALLYTMLGSVVAYAVNGLFSGWLPLFRVSAAMPSLGLVDHLWYVVLGIVAGCVGALLPAVFYGVRDFFRTLPLPAILKPALGGLGVGLIALRLPQVLGGGYGWIQLAIDGRLAVSLMLILGLAKILALAFTVSSRGSGGVFAPALFVGAMIGGALAGVLGQAPAPLVIVGMAAVFGAAARVPIATLLMVTEMTGGYQLLVPAALAVMLSFLVQRILTAHLRYQSIYEDQVSAQADSPAHHVDYLNVAMRLLEQRGARVADSFRHVRLQALLESGIAVDLMDGKQLVLRTVAAGSPSAGRRIGSLFPARAAIDIEIVAIFRGQHMLPPDGDSAVEEGDGLLIIAKPDRLDSLPGIFSPPPSIEAP